MIQQRVDNQVPTPHSLLTRLRDGSDGDDWQLFHELYADLMRRWFLRAGIPAGELEDLMQDSLLALVNGIRRFDHNGRTGAFRTWLKTVVLHRAASWFRCFRGRQEFAGTIQPSELAAVEDRMLPAEWEREHDEHVLRKLLRLVKADVSETTWSAFYQQSFENALPADVALKLGISQNAALLAKSRVVRRLRVLAQGLID